MLREISVTQIQDLLPCLEALDAHHNARSIYFSGTFPAQDNSLKLTKFAEAVKAGTSKIAVITDDTIEEIQGFCKIDFHEDYGKLDYLVVLPAARHKGYGDRLKQWALAKFKNKNLHKIEVKVVYGNEALAFYDKYGFKISSQILLKL